MRTKQNGEYIHLEYEEDWDEMLKMKCVCGHPLSKHYYDYAVGSKKTIRTQGCSDANCDCIQFALKGRIITRNYSYA